jgi:hypothetical protein
LRESHSLYATIRKLLQVTGIADVLLDRVTELARQTRQTPTRFPGSPIALTFLCAEFYDAVFAPLVLVPADDSSRGPYFGGAGVWGSVPKVPLPAATFGPDELFRNPHNVT